MTQTLKNEIMLQVNEQLYIKGVISREIYEQAKVRIVKMSGKEPDCPA